MDLDGVPGLDVALPASQAVYDQSRVSVLADLARHAGGHLATSRTGGVTVKFAQTEPSLHVTRASGRWLDTQSAPTRTGVINTVIAAGEPPAGSDTPILGAAYLRTGPARYGGPMGILREDIASPLWTTSGAAQLAAEKHLARRIASYTRRFEVTARWDPRIEVLDRHVVEAPVRRRLVEIEAIVVDVELDVAAGGDMTITYEAAL